MTLRKAHVAFSVAGAIILYCSISAPCQSVRDKPLYRDEGKLIEERVDDLLSRMTLEEKIGQINMPCVYVKSMGESIEAKMEACRKFAAGTYVDGIGPGGGLFTLPNSILHNGPRQQAEYINELQKIAVEKTRLGIPLLITEEGTHGLMCSGATIFPEGPALGSTWNIDLIRDVYTIAAEEAGAIGVHQLFTLVVEPSRDPRLGRNQEGYSEDPYLCSKIAENIVKAVQGDNVSARNKVVAGLCHYPGQSEPVSGLERGAIEYSERIFREFFLPPWIAGIRDAGALGVMATYPAINGIPVHASARILTHILRDELGFEGLVLGEGGGLSTLVYEGLAPTQKEAGILAIQAGVDVGISFEDAYMSAMSENIRNGSVSEKLLDRAVRRVLKQKFRLGLFENLYVDPDYAVSTFHTKEHVDLAFQAASEGIVLLKNDKGLLPLRKDLKTIAVIGPNADNVRNQLGDYTAWTILQDVVTILEGIRHKISPYTEIRYVKGCNVFNRDVDQIAEASEAAANADVAIVVLGENAWRVEGDQVTSGEGYDVASLDLTGRQEELVKAVQRTGTPTVVVLVNGRPLSIRWIEENVTAIVESWLSGEQGGAAIADILFGDTNPSGRLPVTFPRHVGQLPVYYNHKKSKHYWINKGWGKAFVDLKSPEPLFCFGHGLSYTTFSYANLRITPGKIREDGAVTISVDITNTGDREGKEVIQCYVQDVHSTVATPYQELKAFDKITLKSGETKTVTLTIESKDLFLLDAGLNRVVEPGMFKVMIGHSSKDIRLTGAFEVIH